jgi:hypothetical protein
MKRLALIVLSIGILSIPLPALAHNFSGSGDCDSWNLLLDGDWGATEIFLDGVSIGLELTPEVADSSDSTSRSFTVFWDKPRNDVTVTHTLSRDLSNCIPVTTTTTVPPTTVPESTTTLPPTTTQPETTTTIERITTTTAPESSTTSLVITTSTSEETTTTAATPVSEPPREELPFTGFDPIWLTGLALALGSSGIFLLDRARRTE